MLHILVSFKIHNLQGNVLFILLISVFSAPRINSAWHMESPSQKLSEWMSESPRLFFLNTQSWWPLLFAAPLDTSVCSTWHKYRKDRVSSPEKESSCCVRGYTTNSDWEGDLTPLLAPSWLYFILKGRSGTCCWFTSSVFYVAARRGRIMK